MDTIQAVTEFHETFSVPVADAPRLLPHHRADLRARLIREELLEYEAACASGDIVEILDALIDLQYVLDGTFIEHGMQHIKYEAFAEVHASNMSKRVERGMPQHREDGKVIKGPNFRKPDLAKFLNRG